MAFPLQNCELNYTLTAPSRARILVIRQKRAVQDELINVHSATAPFFRAFPSGDRDAAGSVE